MFGGGDQGYAMPDFFGPQFEELLARSRQRVQAQYGNMFQDLRDAYSSLGLLGNPAALGDAATKASISKGQDIQNQAFDLYSGEFNSQRQFETSRWLTQFQDQLNDPSFVESLLSSLPGLGQAAGMYFGLKGQGGGGNKPLE